MSEKLKLIITYCICLLLLPVALSFGIGYLSAQGALPVFTEAQLSLFINIVVYTVLPLAAILILHRRMAEDAKHCGRLVKWIVPAIVLLYGTAILAAALIQLIDGTMTTDNQSMVLAMQEVSPVLTVWIACLGGPIAEEATFRFAFLSDKEGAARVGLLLVSSVLFGLVHMQAGFSLGALFAYSLLGLVFGWLYITNDNIMFNILVHMGYNGLSLFLTLFLPE